MQRKLLGIISVDSDATVQLLIINTAFVKYLRRKIGVQCSSEPGFIDFQQAYDSVSREFLYNILIEFCIPMKLVSIIKLCLTEMYSRVRVCKNLPTRFLLGMVRNMEKFYRHC